MMATALMRLYLMYRHLLIVIVSTVLFAAGLKSFGQTVFGTADGSWTNAALWSGGLPHAGTNAYIGKPGGVICTVNAGTAAIAESLYVARGKSSGAAAGTLVINAGGRLDLAGMSASYIGYRSGCTGIVNVAGGILNCGSSSSAAELRIGRLSGCYGIINVTAGAVTNVGFVLRRGEINLSGNGLIVPAATFHIGGAVGAAGTVNQTGGILDGNGRNLTVGDDGTLGVYSISGGVATNIGTVRIGNLSGTGLLEIGDNALFQKSSGSFYIADDPDSIGTVMQSGGTNDLGGGKLMIGDEGAGSYYLSGGICSNVDNVILGHKSGAVGILDLSGGGLYQSGDFQIGGATNTVNMLKIRGSTAVFDVVGDILPAAGGSNSWSFIPDSGGISPINVGGDINLSGNLNLDFSDLPRGIKTLVLLVYGGSRSGTFDAVNIVPEGWSAAVEYDDAARQVKLVNISSPPTGAVFIVR